MSVRDITKDLDKLDNQLNALEDALKPLLKALNNSASTMPLLDRAKLYALVNYALETLIFSGLRVDGADAMNHPVFQTELKRVKQYFGKIDAIEKPVEKPTSKLDTEAATRLIKHGLSDDAAIKAKLAEQIAKEKAKAFMRSLGSATKRPAEGNAEDSEEYSGAVGNSKGKAKKQKNSQGNQSLSSRPKRK